ncbi:MAG: carbohydrate kinase [Xenococcus sp. (in: cyanobacteria)]
MNQKVVLFGEVLFDSFPDGNVILGGAPFNVAWHLQAFGISPLFVSRVGDDIYGTQIQEAMKNWGMNLSGLQIDKTHETGLVKVEIIDNEPYYDIVENSAYDFIEFSQLPPLAKNEMLLYHGTLALRNKVSANSLRQIKKYFKPSIFLDVNLRSPWWNRESLDNFLRDTSSLKINEDELSIIVKNEADIISRIQYLFATYSLTHITVTRGKEGAISCNNQGITESIIPAKTIDIVDTVGAGDAFSSVLILGKIKGWGIKETISNAQDFASQVVGIKGATIKDKLFYSPFIKKWNLNTVY